MYGKRYSSVKEPMPCFPEKSLLQTNSAWMRVRLLNAQRCRRRYPEGKEL